MYAHVFFRPPAAAGTLLIQSETMRKKVEKQKVDHDWNPDESALPLPQQLHGYKPNHAH
jgi:hypothetical protein